MLLTPHAHEGGGLFFPPSSNLKGFHMKHHFIIYYLSITILVLSSALTMYHWAFDNEWAGMCFIAIMSGIMVYCNWEGYYE